MKSAYHTVKTDPLNTKTCIRIIDNAIDLATLDTISGSSLISGENITGVKTMRDNIYGKPINKYSNGCT